MHYIKTPTITDVSQLKGLQRGQWVQLAWCDRPSRLHSTNDRGNVTAFHFPGAHSKFTRYCNPQR